MCSWIKIVISITAAINSSNTSKQMMIQALQRKELTSAMRTHKELVWKKIRVHMVQVLTKNIHMD